MSRPAPPSRSSRPVAAVEQVVAALAVDERPSPMPASIESLPGPPVIVSPPGRRGPSCRAPRIIELVVAVAAAEHDVRARRRGRVGEQLVRPAAAGRRARRSRRCCPRPREPACCGPRAEVGAHRLVAVAEGQLRRCRPPPSNRSASTPPSSTSTSSPAPPFTTSGPARRAGDRRSALPVSVSLPAPPSSVAAPASTSSPSPPRAMNSTKSSTGRCRCRPPSSTRRLPARARDAAVRLAGAARARRQRRAGCRGRRSRRARSSTLTRVGLRRRRLEGHGRPGGHCAYRLHDSSGGVPGGSV